MVVGVMFIDKVGGTMLYPFFALYITQKFNVGMTEVGVVLAIFAIAGMVGSMIGGALTDRFGRRRLILFGLVFSAVSTLSLGMVNKLAVLFPLAVVIGLLSDVAGPAYQAMIPDLLTEKQRAEGFGILRVVGNLAWLIGPTIGGFVAGKSFFLLFVMDAVISCIVAVLFFLLIPETKPQPHAGEPETHESLAVTFAGYLRVLRNLPYTAFILASILMGAVYQQMYNSLSVYLRDRHHIQPQGYGFLLTLSAIVVILLQFPTTQIIKHRPPFRMMALGTLFYMIGFSMFGFVSTYWLFGLAIVVITLGEMIIMPTSQALAANFAPEDMRGRYMAVYGLSWAMPAMFAPLAAGLILDNLDPNLLWYIGGVLCAMAALAFYSLHNWVGRQERFAQNTEDVPVSAD
jgi:MFS family permease